MIKPRQKTDIKTSVWKRLMESARQRDDAVSASVLVFGDHHTGKKTLINSLLAKKNQTNELNVPNEKSILADVKKKGELNAIFDYKYLRINKFDDDDLNELGKINFYCFKEKYTVG
jgi:hypothetical protein